MDLMRQRMIDTLTELQNYSDELIATEDEEMGYHTAYSEAVVNIRHEIGGELRKKLLHYMVPSLLGPWASIGDVPEGIIRVYDKDNDPWDFGPTLLDESVNGWSNRGWLGVNLSHVDKYGPFTPERTDRSTSDRVIEFEYGE